MRVAGARADFGFVEPPAPPRERRFVRNHYSAMEREHTRRANVAEQAATILQKATGK